MTNWIECNLPWQFHLPYEDAPKYPTDIIDARERTEFGTTVVESRKLNGENIEFYNSLKDYLEDKIYDSLDPEKITYDEFVKTPEYAKIVKDFWVIYETKPKVIAVRAHQALKEKVEAWEAFQPEVIEYHKKYNEFSILEKSKSFRGLKLNKPGTLIELENGSIELIGSINTSAGVCDDCTSFDGGTIITRYAVVYDF